MSILSSLLYSLHFISDISYICPSTHVLWCVCSQVFSTLSVLMQHGIVHCCSEFTSVQDGIYMVWKAYLHCTSSQKFPQCCLCRSDVNGPCFPFSADQSALSLSMPLSSRWLSVCDILGFLTAGSVLVSLKLKIFQGAGLF